MHVFQDFSGLRALTGAKVVLCDRIVENALIRQIVKGMLLTQWGPSKSMARDSISHGLNVIGYSRSSCHHSCTYSWLRFFATKTGVHHLAKLIDNKIKKEWEMQV